MMRKDEPVQQLLELKTKIPETTKRLRSDKEQNAWHGSRYRDGMSTRLDAIYSEQDPAVIASLQQQREALGAQTKKMPDD